MIPYLPLKDATHVLSGDNHGDTAYKERYQLSFSGNIALVLPSEEYTKDDDYM